VAKTEDDVAKVATEQNDKHSAKQITYGMQGCFQGASAQHRCTPVAWLQDLHIIAGKHDLEFCGLGPHSDPTLLVVALYGFFLIRLVSVLNDDSHRLSYLALFGNEIFSTACSSVFWASGWSTAWKLKESPTADWCAIC
jgi:hypothetical protein